MKYFLTYLVILIGTLGLSQSKEEFIKTVELDTVVQYEGEGALSLGNCLVLKFTGDAKQFINQLVGFHAQTEEQVERTTSTLAIYETSKPYWIYGKYSVFAEMRSTDNYTYIEIYFVGYSNPDNLKIRGAAPEYQKLVNKVLWR